MVVAGLDGEDVEMIIDDTLASPEFSADGEEVLVAPYVGGLAPEDAAPTEIVTSDGEEVALDEEDPGHVSLQLAADGSADGREVTTGVYAAPYRMATGRSPVWSTGHDAADGYVRGHGDRGRAPLCPRALWRGVAPSRSRSEMVNP